MGMLGTKGSRNGNAAVVRWVMAVKQRGAGLSVRIPAVNLFPISIAIVPADPDGGGDLSDSAAWRGFGPKSFWSRGGWRGGRMGCSSTGFPAVLESQPGSVQCCPLLQTLPITGELM